MDPFNFDNLSSSINAQLNKGIDLAKKENSKLQKGKRINKASDDVGTFSVNSKINSELKQKTKRIQNLQPGEQRARNQNDALQI